MSLPEGYDVKLERVEEIGISNRRLWVYKLKFGRKQRHREICVDFDGKLGNFSNPDNFDGRSATDHADFEWGGTKFKKVQIGNDPSNKKDKTHICLKSKKDKNIEIDKDVEIELRFVGPANGKAGKVSLHTKSVVAITNSNRRSLQDLDWGEKGSTEVPIAMTVEGEANENEPDQTFAFLDLDSVLDLETASADIDAILAAPLSAIAGLPADRWALIAEATGATNVGELIENEAIEHIGRLREFL